jgi:hypothetical protein
MWDEFVDHPMRKDYREPDDYEYEPTPHDDVLERANNIMRRGRNWTARNRLQPRIHTDETQMRKRFRLRRCKSVFIRGLSEFVKRA